MPITDLDIFAADDLVIRVLDGSELHLPKPSVRLMLAAFTFERALQDAMTAGDDELASSLTIDILTRVLSTNRERIAVDEEWMVAHGIIGDLAAVVYNTFAEHLHTLVDNPKLRLPSIPGGDDDDRDAPFMAQVGTVCDFAKVSIDAALDMACDMFSACVKQAYINRMNESEGGRKYLADCERLTKTEPDYDALRSLPGYRQEG